MENNNDGLFSLNSLPRKSGYMYKKGGVVKGQGGRRNWKKRWFVFHPTEYRGKDAYELQYFDAPNGNLKGTVGLFDVEVYCETKSTHKKVKFEFQLLLQNGGILQLSCDSEEEREEWISSLNILISYLRKVVLSSGYSISGYDPTYEDEEQVYELGEEVGKQCKVFGPGLVGAEAGHKTHFLIQVNDLDGVPAEEGGMPIIATISNDNHLFYIRIIDNQDGTYSGYYAIGLPGIYDLHIRLNDEHDIDGSPFQIEILPTKTAAEYCIAVGENINSCYPGVTSSFIIYAKDIYGNSKHKGGDPFEVSIVGPATLQSLMDNGDGSYTCCFEAKSPTDLNYFAPSSLLLSVTLYGKHISGSPFHPTILSQPPPTIIPPIIPTKEEQIEVEINNLTTLFKDANVNEEFSEQIKETLEESPPPTSIPTSTPISIPDEEVQNRPTAVPKLTSKKRDSILNKEIAKIEESSGVPLSRLERARQRALMARKISDTQAKKYAAAAAALEMSPTTPSSTMTQAVDSSSASSATRSVRRASVMRTDVDPITGLPVGIRKQNMSSTAPALSSSSSSSPLTTNLGSSGDQRNQNDDFSSLLSPNPNGNWTITDSELSKLLNPQPSISAAASANATRSANQARRASVLRQDIDPITGLPLSLNKPSLKSNKPSTTTATTTTATSTTMKGKNPFDDDSIESKREKDTLITTRNDSKAYQTALSGGNLSKTDIDSVLFSLSGGLSGTVPSAAGDEERIMWDLTEQALQSSEVTNMLLTDLSMLKTTFDLMSSIVEGVQILKLTNSSNSSGAFKLLEQFDVVPAYLTMREVKKAFSLVLAAQRNAKVVASMAGGGTGVDFSHFVKFLVMLAEFALSKTTAFQALYKTPASKIDVMLHKWGVADKVRIQLVKNDLAIK